MNMIHKIITLSATCAIFLFAEGLPIGHASKSAEIAELAEQVKALKEMALILKGMDSQIPPNSVQSLEDAIAGNTCPTASGWVVIEKTVVPKMKQIEETAAEFTAKKKPGYKFGDLTRGIIRSARAKCGG